MRFLNSRERKAFIKQLQEQYGYEKDTDYLICELGKNKYYFFSPDVAAVDLHALRPQHIGLYVANTMKTEIRLTIDGAHLLAGACSHERIELTAQQMEEWMGGDDVQMSEQETPFRIVEHQGTILGCGKIKDGYLLNYVPKGRRIQEFHSSSPT